MQNSSQDKTEEPTEKKIKDSLKEGQVARSKDLSSSLTLLVTLVLLSISIPTLGEYLVDYAKSAWSFTKDDVNKALNLPSLLHQGVLLIVWAGVAIALPTFVFILFVGSFPGKIVFLLNNIAPKASRLNPLAGLKRMVGKESLVELLKSIFKVFSVSFIVYFFVRNFIFNEKIGGLNDFYVTVGFWLPKIFVLSFIIVIGFFVIAMIDSWYQKLSHTNKLKMTKQEVKDERKNTDGNPEVKNRIRSLQREMAAQRLSERVPQADVVITNPTHFSVAIHYDESVSQAPYVIAKGVDHLAAQIKLLAGAHQVQIIESPSLARAVYYTTQVDQEIPGNLYKPVAQILSYVAQCKAHENGITDSPPKQPSIHVPGY